MINEHYESKKKEYVSGLLGIDRILKENFYKFEICCCIYLMILKNENDLNMKMMNKLANSIQQLHNNNNQKCDQFLNTFIFQIPLISLIKEYIKKVLEFCDLDDILINKLMNRCKKEESFLLDLSIDLGTSSNKELIEKKRYRYKIIRKKKDVYKYRNKYILIKKALEEKSKKMNKDQSVLSTKEDSNDEPHIDFNLSSVIDLNSSSIEYQPTTRDYFKGNWFGNITQETIDIPPSTGINAKFNLNIPLFTLTEQKKKEPPPQPPITKRFCNKLEPDVLKMNSINQSEATKASENECQFKKIQTHVNKNFYNTNDILSSFSEYTEEEPPTNKTEENTIIEESDILAYKTPTQREYFYPVAPGSIDTETARKNMYYLYSQRSNHK